MATKASAPDDWNAHYENDHTPWDLGAPAHALVRLLQSLGPEPLEVLIPGAGNGHDAIGWARAGHFAVAVDFAPRAVDAIRHNAAAENLPVEALNADIFALPPRFNGRFHAVWEQTCLCAIPPERRPEYVDAMWRCLRPGGMLYALLWNHGRPDGPPFDLPSDTAKNLLQRRFNLLDEQPVTGSPRQGEYLLTLQRQG